MGAQSLNLLLLKTWWREERWSTGLQQLLLGAREALQTMVLP